MNKHGATINEIHTQARLHTQKSKGMIEPGKWYQSTGEALPVISKEVTSELLHCLTALPERRPCGEVGRAVSFDDADRLPVVVRFPAGPQVSLKVGDQPKGRWRRPKKKV